ncbi:MAG TPA: hypothetical protein VFC63_04005 [Blastocatellia bacterium]|nr:hypothetical protein [Blastocatellia bacterium]
MDKRTKTLFLTTVTERPGSIQKKNPSNQNLVHNTGVHRQKPDRVIPPLGTTIQQRAQPNQTPGVQSRPGLRNAAQPKAINQPAIKRANSFTQPTPLLGQTALPRPNHVRPRPDINQSNARIVQPALHAAALSRLNIPSRLPLPKPVIHRIPSIVQRVKIYPNLHPGAAVPVDRDNIFKLNYFADQYRLNKLNNHGAYVPNLKYNFVRTQEGEMLLHNRFRHPSLADGKQVLYAGEVSFNNGKLSWWSNGSGHYQPDEDYAKQAGLPMDYFYSYQQILKGEHDRKKGDAR